jgi:hypothetical protein
MKQIYVELPGRSTPWPWVLTPDGLFRLANPRAVSPGRVHLVEYHPHDQFATVVAVRIDSDTGRTNNSNNPNTNERSGES